ncbi:MAG: lipocalin family protein [Fluviicola sp.]|nr:lipocalin family protein [Fluviicola sp.]
MKLLNYKTTIALEILFLFLILISSCTPQPSEDKTKIKEEKPVIQEKDVVNGTWKIDSLAYDDKVFDRPISNDSVYQGLTFRKDGSLHSVEKTKIEMSRPMGKYQLKGDQFLLFSEKGKIMSTGTFMVKNDQLVLNDVFPDPSGVKFNMYLTKLD